MKVLNGNSETAEKQAALVRLCQIYLSGESKNSADTGIVSTLGTYSNVKGALGKTSAEMLANIYAAAGQLNRAQAEANSIIKKYPGTEIEKQALILEASLYGYNQKLSSFSLQALGTLETQFSSSIDSGLVAALGGFNNTSAKGAYNKLASRELTKTGTGKLTFQLGNYPNPFNPTTIIKYQIPQNSFVTLKVYDELGRLVNTLVNQYENKGTYNVNFNASYLASGIYFYRLRAGNFVSTKKMLLLK